MSRQRRKKAVTPKVRREVMERDRGQCIFCTTVDSPTMAHYISRAQGGLGIKENLAVVCIICHHKLDHTPQREEYKAVFKAYLDRKYPGFPDDERIYKNRWDL